jgi:hypothetical protein
MFTISLRLLDSPKPSTGNVPLNEIFINRYYNLSVMTSNINEINITRHLERFQKVLGETGLPILALLTCVSDIAVEIKRSLMSQETLAFNKEGQTPILECIAQRAICGLYRF